MISGFWPEYHGGYTLYWERKMTWTNWSGWKMWKPSVLGIISLNISNPNCIFSFKICADSITLTFLQSLIVRCLISPMKYYEKRANVLCWPMEIKAQRSNACKSAGLELKSETLCCKGTEPFAWRRKLPEEKVAGFTRVFCCLYKKRKKYLYT